MQNTEKEIAEVKEAPDSNPDEIEREISMEDEIDVKILSKVVE